VNIINVANIQQLVSSAFDPQSAATGTKPTGKSTASPDASALPSSDVTVDVYNGNPSAAGLAAQVSQALVGLGYKAGKVENSSAQTQTVQPGNQIFYGDGAAASAQQIAVQFGATARALSSLPADHVEVLIGSAVSAVPTGISPTSAATAGTQSAGTQSTGAQVIGEQTATGPTATPTPTSSAGQGSSGTSGSVTVAPNAPYGVPCVY
jgi:hypothetical protein